MTNVITLPTTTKPLEDDDMIWICGHCSQSAFELHSDGTTECRGCGHRGEYPDGAWVDWKPTVEAPDAITRTTTLFDSAAFAQRNVIKQIDDDTTVLVVADDSGKIRAWSLYNHEASPAAKVTVRYLLDQAATLILGEPPLERPDDALPVGNE